MASEVRFEVSDDEREELLLVMRQPGYAVLLKIMASYVEAQFESAQNISANDPLNHRDQVVNAWLYATTAKSLMVNFKNGVDFERDIHRLRTQESLTREETEKRRRQMFALEAIPE